MEHSATLQACVQYPCAVPVSLIVTSMSPAVQKWPGQGMIIDEAQKIKNHGALVSKAIKEVGNAIGHTRIALSGRL